MSATPTAHLAHYRCDAAGGQRPRVPRRTTSVDRRAALVLLGLVGLACGGSGGAASVDSTDRSTATPNSTAPAGADPSPPIATSGPEQPTADTVDTTPSSTVDSAGVGDAPRPAVVDPAVIGPFTGAPEIVLPWKQGFLVITGEGDGYDPNAPMRYRAAYTVDGSLAEEVKFELPVGYPQFVVDDDRVVAFAGTGDLPQARPMYSVFASTDLSTWQRSDVDISLWESPQDGFVHSYAIRSRPVVIGDHWYGVAAIPWRRWEMLLPPDIQVALRDAAGWSHSDVDADGAVIVEVYDELTGQADPEPSRQWRVTRDDLLVDGEPLPADMSMDNIVGGGLPSRDVLLVADFSGNVEVLPLPEQLEELQEGAVPNLIRYGDGLMLIGWNVYTSADGREWSELGQARTRTVPGDVEYIVAGTAGDNVVLYEAYGDEMVRIEPGGDVVDVDYPEQLDRLYSPGSPTVWVAGPSTGDDWWERDLWLIATSDGVDWFTLDLPDITIEQLKRWTGSFGNGPYQNGERILFETVEGWKIVEMP